MLLFGKALDDGRKMGKDRLRVKVSYRVTFRARFRVRAYLCSVSHIGPA